jgi:hypothetical protein
VFVLTSRSQTFAGDFAERVVPFVNEYCVKCHNSKTSEGELNLTQFKSAEMLGEHFRQWEHVVTFLEKEEMPPDGAKQPSKKLRGEILVTIQNLLVQEAKKLDGDPGVVLPRRLSNSEYNYTVRDLTGTDIQPAKAFPIDPASGEGFNNTGEALTMSPSLFKKYYAAAEHIADHLLLKPSGFDFAPYSVVTYADQKKFYEGAIIDFYRRHNVDYRLYLYIVWKFQNQNSEGPRKSIEQFADDHKLSRKYLKRLADALERDSKDEFYLRWLRHRWQKASSFETETKTVRAIHALAADLKRLSQSICMQETQAIRSNAGNPPIYHTDRRRISAAERDKFNEKLIAESRHIHTEFRDLNKREQITLLIHVEDPSGGNDGFVTLSELNFSKQSATGYRSNDTKKNTPFAEVLAKHAPNVLKGLQFGMHPKGKKVEPSSLVLASGSLLKLTIPTKAFAGEKRIFFHAKATIDSEHTKGGQVRVALYNRQPSRDDLEQASHEVPLLNLDHPITDRWRKSGREFCSLFPNRFLYVDDTRGLSAGFHLIEGFFRDDQPLCKWVLNDAQNAYLDRLWNELYFGTDIAEKLLRGFVFFERSERNFMKHSDFDSIKEEDPKLVEEESQAKFRQIYLARSNVKVTGKELAEHPISVFFESIRSGLKKRKTQLANAQPIYLRRLEQFARNAYRRPLTNKELKRLRAFYNATAEQPEFGIEQAVRASIIRLLVSPHFCYRMDSPPAGELVKPLPDIALASRLSYFLWSSTPDSDLLRLAEVGELTKTATLRSQTKRMLKDPKVEKFALEFFGQWLGYRDFLDRESVNRNVFREFDDELKQAMFEEPTRVITHLIQNDLPVTELLSSDSTFMNKRLARHYDLGFTPLAKDDPKTKWLHVSGMRDKGRGGILGMAVFLTKNSQPERTSPVKRGFWVFHKVLGQHIPAPPDDVAVLPAKETDTNGKTIRELLKLHTDDAKCARCHVRFDPIGLAMEGFDPIGKARGKDLAGRAIDNVVQLPNGKEVRGVPGYSDYLVKGRRDAFIKTLCRKFLGYALGRSLVLSDQPLLEKMQQRLKQNEFRFSALFETVVFSPQFLNQRCRNFTVAKYRER